MNMQQMVGDSKCRSRPYYFRRCKKERLIPTSIDSLPDELLFLILVCLPADYLHDSARLVCRRWNHIIHSKSFINAHFQQSKYCLLLSYDCYADWRPTWIMTATSQGLIQTNEFSYKFKEMFFSSCNGLMLEKLSCENNILILQIMNPATKQELVLPPFTAPVGTAMDTTFASIAYAATSMKYKVAISYRTYSSSFPPSPGLAILTVGVDNSWRQVQVDQYLSECATKLLLRVPVPLLTEGFMHWAEHMNGKMVVTLDVETEILTVSELPFPSTKCESKFYLSTGRSLSVLIGRGKYNRFFELWEMNPETKEWMKLVDEIKLGDQQQQLRLLQLGIRPDVYLRPLGWLKYPKVLILCVHDFADTSTSRFHRSNFISYNRDTHEINLTEFPRTFWYYVHVTLPMYKSSFLWLT